MNSPEAARGVALGVVSGLLYGRGRSEPRSSHPGSNAAHTQLQEEELPSRLSPRTSHVLWQPEADHPACGSPPFLILKNGIITILISWGSWDDICEPVLQISEGVINADCNRG